MRISLVIFLFFCTTVFCNAQNLIPDSSFENNKAIPTEFSAIGNSNTWSRVGMGTTDLFSESNKRKGKYSMVDIPQNAMGFQFPHSGKSYAGFFLFSHGDYREYLQTPLTEPLKKGKTYQLSLYINLANYAQTSIDQIGFYFDKEEKHFSTSDVLENTEPVYIKLGKSSSDTSKWRQVSGRYRARGGETYIVIGSFHINKIRRTGFSFPKNLRTPVNKHSMRDAYYFVDDVSLVELTNIPDPPDSLMSIGKDTLANLVSGAPLVMKNVLFETNRSTLSAVSYPDLDKLVDYLQMNPGYKIEISGHTDSTGNEKVNKRLSMERARRIQKYLEEKGIEKSRLEVFGYGAEKPLFSNDTEEHRAANRRVEVVFNK